MIAPPSVSVTWTSVPNPALVVSQVRFNNKQQWYDSDKEEHLLLMVEPNKLREHQIYDCCFFAKYQS